jgi:putative SOS response-associated peptidase YedK
VLQRFVFPQFGCLAAERDASALEHEGILGREVWPEWLGEEPADSSRLKALLSPYPSEEMICWPVSARVGNVKNNDPSLIEPIAGAG